MDKPPETADLAEQIAALAAALAQQRQELRTAEASLVSRIADVDDDRRLTTNRLQRAWQTHHEEVDARLKRHTSLLLGGLLGLAILFAVGLVFAYGHLDSVRRALLAESAELRQEQQRLSAISVQDREVQQNIRQLRDSVSALAETLETAIGDRSAATDPARPTARVEGAAVPEAVEPPSDPSTTAESIPSEPTPLDSEAPSESASPEASEQTAPGPTNGQTTTAADETETAPPVTAPALPPVDLDLPAVASNGGETPETDARPAEETAPEGPSDAPPTTDLVMGETETVRAPSDAAVPATANSADVSPSTNTVTRLEDAAAEPAAAASGPEPSADDLEATGDSGLERASPPAGPTRKAPPQVAVSERPLVIDQPTFALQIIGFYSLNSLLDFARREQLPQRVYYREETYQGRPWFVLIHSLHARDADAKETIGSLPKEIAMLDLWVRNLTPGTALGVVEIGPEVPPGTP
jgi:DamX protein